MSISHDLEDLEKQSIDAARRLDEDLERIAIAAAVKRQAIDEELQRSLSQMNNRFARSSRFAWKYHHSLSELRQMRLMQSRAVYERRRASR